MARNLLVLAQSLRLVRAQTTVQRLRVILAITSICITMCSAVCLGGFTTVHVIPSNTNMSVHKTHAQAPSHPCTRAQTY